MTVLFAVFHPKQTSRASYIVAITAGIGACMERQIYLVAGLFFSALTLTGCPNKSSSDPTKSTSAETQAPAAVGARTVTISSITPSTEKPLQAGTKVRLAVNVDYEVPKPGGILGIVVQDSNNGPVKSNLKEVPSGAGKMSSEIEFIVPNVKHIDVHVPLYVKGETKSSQVAVKQFKIIPK